MNHVIADNIEAWMLVDGYDNYEVSSIGRVRNNVTGRILKSRVNTKGYVDIGLSKDGQHKKHEIHRLVARAFCRNDDEKKQVDHIDHNPLNNHYSNLRWTTGSENARNKQLTSNNTSGFKGVCFDNTHNRWRAKYSINYQKKHIGYYRTKEEAGKAYDRAVLEVDPEHAVLNFPIPEAQRNVYISYHTLKKHLAEIKSIIDGFNKL